MHFAAQMFYEGCGYDLVFGSLRIIVSSAAKSFDIKGGAVVTDHPNGARVAAQSRLAASISPNPPVEFGFHIRWLLMMHLIREGYILGCSC
jgi:hypothetical protein